MCPGAGIRTRVAPWIGEPQAVTPAVGVANVLPQACAVVAEHREGAQAVMRHEGDPRRDPVELGLGGSEQWARPSALSHPGTGAETP